MGVKFGVSPERRIYVERLHLKKEQGQFEIMTFLTRRIFSCGNERAVRRIWWKNTAGR